MNKRETPQKVTMCDGCKKINPIWRHADRYNSSRFCVICGSYCSDYTFYENEIRRYEQEHEKYILSKRMKVRVLLNKIAKGEEVPANIRYDNVNWKYIKDSNDYYSDEWLVKSYLAHCCFEEFADDEIEIIEEDKPIEKIRQFCEYPCSDNYECWSIKEEILVNKINELIDEVNKLKKESDK